MQGAATRRCGTSARSGNVADGPTPPEPGGHRVIAAGGCVARRRRWIPIASSSRLASGRKRPVRGHCYFPDRLLARPVCRPRYDHPVGPDSTLRAVLFDFNGVLVDDESYHWRAFRDILAPLGARVTRRLYDRRYLAWDDFAACRLALRDARVAPSRRGAAAVRRLVARKRR